MSQPEEIPKAVNSLTVFNSFFQIKKETLLYKNKEQHDYYTLIPPNDAVSILALTSTNQYLLIREYRHPIGCYLLGCPGGYLNPGEDPLKAAERELLEETGYGAKNFTLMGCTYPYAGISQQKISFVLAEGASWKKDPELEPQELLTTVLLTQEELKQVTQPLDGMLCSALYFKKGLLEQ